MIHCIIGLPMLTKAKTMKSLGQSKLQKKILAKWDDRGMKISSVIDAEIKFGIHVIAPKIYISS